MVKPSPKALVEAGGISPSYAHMILSESDDHSKSRTPPRSLAIVIYRATGWKHSSIAELSEEAIALFEQHDPWTPPKERQDEAA
jgi:hypothetical protein